MQSACQISAYAHYARTPVLQLKQRTDDYVCVRVCVRNYTLFQPGINTVRTDLHVCVYMLWCAELTRCNHLIWRVLHIL